MKNLVLLLLFFQLACGNRTTQNVDNMDQNTKRMADQMEVYQKYIELLEAHMAELQKSSLIMLKELEMDRQYLQVVAVQLTIMGQAMADFQAMGKEFAEFLKEMVFKPQPPAKSPDIDDVITGVATE